MERYMALVTPLTNRKVKKSCEQAFASTVTKIDTSIKSVKEAGNSLGIILPDQLTSTLENNMAEHFNNPSDLLDARYFIAMSIKNIISDRRPLYKVPLSLLDYAHLRNELTKTVTVA